MAEYTAESFNTTGYDAGGTGAPDHFNFSWRILSQDEATNQSVIS